MTSNLPTMPLNLNAVAPTTPNKTAISCRQLKLFSTTRNFRSRQAVRSPQTRTNAVQDNANRTEDSRQDTSRIHKPYLASLAIHNSEKTAALRISSTLENMKRYPFVARKSNVSPGSEIGSITKPVLKCGLTKGSTVPENKDRKQVTFNHQSRQSERKRRA